LRGFTTPVSHGHMHAQADDIRHGFRTELQWHTHPDRQEENFSGGDTDIGRLGGRHGRKMKRPGSPAKKTLPRGTASASIYRMRIWDLHCHMSGVAGLTPEERLKALLVYADRMGIERLCVYMGMKWSHDPSPADLVQQNNEVLRAIAKFPDRMFGFVYLNAKHPEESLAELERCVANGPMVGVKLWVAEKCSVPGIDAIIRRAAELKAAIFQHTWFKTNGNYPGESTPDDIVTLAKRFPEVPIICGHTGGTWELGIRAIRAQTNLYADLAGSDPTAGFTEMAVRELGAARVLYGSDAGGRSFASQLAKVHGAQISEADKQKIFCDNLRGLLLPILKAKGIQA
jgi:predicted TIM-barrel fold metal-dependent hydrolase